MSSVNHLRGIGLGGDAYAVVDATGRQVYKNGQPQYIHRGSREFAERAAAERGTPLSKALTRTEDAAPVNQGAGTPSGATNNGSVDERKASWLERHPDKEERIRARRDADAVHFAQSQEFNEREEVRYREFQKEQGHHYAQLLAQKRDGVDITAPVSPLANYRPGSALARSCDRDGFER